jgi:hypothetical protein
MQKRSWSIIHTTPTSILHVVKVTTTILSFFLHLQSVSCYSSISSSISKYINKNINNNINNNNLSLASSRSSRLYASSPTYYNKHQTSFLLKIDGEQDNEQKQRQSEGTESTTSSSEGEDYTHLLFEYDFNELKLSGSAPSISTSTSSPSAGRGINSTKSQTKKTTIVLLIQPIGVGIGKWYYNRLLREMNYIYNVQEEEEVEGGGEEISSSSNYNNDNLIFLVPDLIGCGSASNPKKVIQNDIYSGDTNVNANVNTHTHLPPVKKIPLLQVDDWADQLIDLMVKYEETEIPKNDNNSNKKNINKDDDEIIHNEYNWCIVSNGGCVPIALEIGKRYVQAQKEVGREKGEREGDASNDIMIKNTLTNIILSATPSSQSLFSVQDKEKVQKSYQTLSGLPGSLFWWYALRNNGKFIQNFSEKNLAAKAENLGDSWTPTCVETAKAFEGRSRFSTFAFLAGSLNGDNNERLEVLGGGEEKAMRIDVITGGDKRRNRARSWFWEKRSDKVEEEVRIEKTTLVPILQQNGNGGQEFIVGGRRCPAHEDARGFSQALLKIIAGQSNK